MTFGILRYLRGMKFGAHKHLFKVWGIIVSREFGH